MSFWSKLGHGALKVGKYAAPIALGMTGVGLPAAMAVSGGLNALDKKTSGGSWKDALGAGVSGAASAAMGSGLGKMGGFAGKLGSKLGDPTGVRAAVSGVAGKVGGLSPSAGSGFMGMLGKGINVASGMMNNQQKYRTPGFAGGYPGSPSPMGMNNGMRRMGGSYMNTHPQSQGQISNNPMAMGRMNQQSPNLAYAIMRGRQEAMMNQPWRTPPINPDPSQQMPNIYPNMQRMGIGPSQY